MKQQPPAQPAFTIFFEEVNGRQIVNIESIDYILATLAKVNGVSVPDIDEIRPIFIDSAEGSVQRALDDVHHRETLITYRLYQIRHELSKLF